MGFDNYGSRRCGRNDEHECTTCQAVASGDLCMPDCGCHQRPGGYHEWQNDGGCPADSGCQEGCGVQPCASRQNDCECAVRASAGRAVRPARSSECIDGEAHIYFETCEGAKEVAVISECHNEDSLGRVLDVSMTLCNMCPGRRCAVGVHLAEVDESGAEYTRGFRAITVPAHNHSQNRDVALPALRFILPEDVSVVSGSCRRHFVVRATNHYMDEADCSWGGWNNR